MRPPLPFAFVSKSLLIVFLLTALLPLTAARANPTPLFRVYLTFEDGPTDAYTPEILDILTAFHAKATFFVSGAQIKGHEGLLQRELREGHAIGNHAWVEPGAYIGSPDAAVRESYLKTEAAIRAALGPERPRYEAQVKLFRQPAGGAKPLPIPGAQVITYNWNVSSDDCAKYIDFNHPLTYDQQVVLNVIGKSRFNDPLYNNVYDFGDGVVVVFHDINRVTGRVLPGILRDMQAAGATFVALPRPEDRVGTMPISLDDRPSAWEGMPDLALPATITENAVARAYPSFKGRISASLGAGTPVTAVGRTVGWVRIQYNDQVGWVSSAQIKVRGPVHSLPAVTVQ